MFLIERYYESSQAYFWSIVFIFYSKLKLWNSYSLNAWMFRKMDANQLALHIGH